MSSPLVPHAHPPLIRTGFNVALLLVLLLSLSWHTPMWSSDLRAQPALLEWVAQHPEQRVQVIVQKQGHDPAVDSLIAQLDGNITKDLRIINAVAAELPAAAVTTLARAKGVRWVSLDAPNVETAKLLSCVLCIDTSSLANPYIWTVGANKVWNTAPYLQGQGIGVAVVDSGIADENMSPALRDFSNGQRIVASMKFNSAAGNPNDKYGHGTHVAGIIGGNGSNSNGAYMGIAPKVNLINVKVSDDQGAGTASDVVNALQWILQNKATYNIRVVNISLNSSVQESYHQSPLDAAVEILWFNGIVVVVSAGNEGRNALYPPANDPFVITVGATDDRGTALIADDEIASFSGAGTIEGGHIKPDLVAPGRNIVSVNASNGSVLSRRYPNHIVHYNREPTYFRMSGTSMSAPMVSGAVALLLQDEPNLTPDQVKYRLKATAAKFGWNYDQRGGAGLLDIYEAVNGTTTESANTGIEVSQLLRTGSEPIT